MIEQKKPFIRGAIMLILFAGVFVLVFSPVFNGKNGLEYLDALYNSISKGSAYYIPDVKKETDKLLNKNISLNLDLEDKSTASQALLLFQKSGAAVEILDTKLKVSGDFGVILNSCLSDADNMYNNDGKKVVDKYGYNERQVLYNWWKSLNEMDKDLKRQEKFQEANVVLLLKNKAVETAYNYYKIKPQKITDQIVVVICSLIFYVIYTIWYGFSIMYLFEGWGLKLEDH